MLHANYLGTGLCNCFHLFSGSFGTHPFLYYIGLFDPGLKTLVADYSGDGRDDVVLYDSLASGLTVALNRGPSPAFAWMGFDLFEGVLGSGLSVFSKLGEFGAEGQLMIVGDAVCRPHQDYRWKTPVV